MFDTNLHIFHSKIAWLGVFSAKQPAGRNSQKNTGKLGATPNQAILEWKSGALVVKTALILTLTPKTNPPPPPVTLLFSEKNPKKNRIYYCKFANYALFFDFSGGGGGGF